MNNKLNPSHTASNNQIIESVLGDMTSHLEKVISFYAVAEYGSMSKASTILDVSIPAISKRIKALEDILKTQLFFRNNRGITLTADGIAFVQACEPFCKPLMERLKDTEHNNHNYVQSQIILPTPFPCASTMWELVAEAITDNTLCFNFSPDGMPGLFVSFVSMVYKFEQPISLLGYSVMNVDLSFKTGDFNQINLEFHGEDSNGVMNVYAPPIELLKKGGGEYQKVYHVFLNDSKRKNALERLREICFVVPLHVMLKAQDKSGSFKINNIEFK